MSPLIVANWKMQLDDPASIETASLLRDTTPEGAEVVICPPFTALARVAEAIADSALALGAQDCAWTMRGALTGEVSPSDLAHVGCRYVILGHSERRQHLHEDDDIVARKLRAALAAGLQPILCVGETLEARDLGQREAILITQLRALQGLELVGSQRCCIAYEPVWAIGTGRAAAPEDASQAHAFIRDCAAEHLGTSVARVRILYGGSVQPENVAVFLAQPQTDGVLVGTAGQTAARLRNLIAAAVGGR